MTRQWIELNSELYALETNRAKKRPRFIPGRMYQGNTELGGFFRRLFVWWRQ